MENAPILMGYISKFVEDGVQIASKEDRLPLIHCNTTVKISVMNSALGFKILIGRVYLSTEEFLRVVDVQTAMDYEKRNFFRVKVDVETEAFPVKAVTETGAASSRRATPSGSDPGHQPQRAVSCLSSYSMNVGDQLIVNLDLYGTVVSLLCKVVRKIPVELGTEDGYGCEFLDNSGRQFDLLCKYLFDCQREQIQIMKQSPGNHSSSGKHGSSRAKSPDRLLKLNK